MNENLYIKQADALNDGEIMVVLSDNRSLLLTLEQVLATNWELVPEPIDDENSLPL